MLESTYQAQLIKRLNTRFPGALILKMDPLYLQGIQDLLLLWNDCWALLEVKASKDSPVRPNQPYYVELANRMSFSAFIYPENETEVLDAIQQTFQSRRKARVPQSK